MTIQRVISITSEETQYLWKFDNGKDDDNKKGTNIKRWRLVCIIFWIVCLLYVVYDGYSILSVDLDDKGDIFIVANWTLWTLLAAYMIIGICLVISKHRSVVNIATVISDDDDEYGRI